VLLHAPSSQISIPSPPLCLGQRLKRRPGLDLGREHLDKLAAVGADPAPVADEPDRPEQVALDHEGVEPRDPAIGLAAMEALHPRTPWDLTPDELREAWGEDLAAWYAKHLPRAIVGKEIIPREDTSPSGMRETQVGISGEQTPQGVGAGVGVDRRSPQKTSYLQ
jgi:hypothetical protein